jgi:unsaturated rhamnogalacturonyl hydrolase
MKMSFPKVYKTLLFICLLISTTEVFAQNQQQPMVIAEKMANTIMQTYPDSMVVMKYINHLMQDGQASDTDLKEGVKASNKRPANWNYEIGVVMMGFERLWRTTGDFRYYQYLKHIVEHFITPEGSIRTYKMEEYNSDNIPTGRQLLTIYQTQREEKFLKAAQILQNQVAWQPRNKVGGYWHKLKYPYQMWLDGLYMIQPFAAEYASMTGNVQAFDDIINQFVWMEKYGRDEKTGLLYHGWDESKLQQWANKTTGQSPNFWSRAMGWYIMALVDVLDYVPEKHPRRAELIGILNRLSTALVNFQDTKSGVWWQVTDKGGKEGNYLESSGSAMFVYGLAKAVRMGYIPVSFRPAVKKGYEGILREFIETDANGLIHYTKAVGGAGLGGVPYRDGTYDYYVKEPTRKDDLKAIGPLIQALVEIDLMDKQIDKSKTVLLDNYFNNEYRNSLPFHYLWNDRFDSGYSWFGSVLRDMGAKTTTLTTEPTLDNLKTADVYIITDPDTKKETANPNFVQAQHIKTLMAWVKAGGTLVLLANDTTNCEITHFNELTKAFGISLTGKSVNMVKNDIYEQGKIELSGNHSIFKDTKKIFVKELVTLAVTAPAKALVTSNDDIIIATASIDKGRVFVLGDPWIYNEYVNGRKLPAEYQNFKAMKYLAEWLIK